MLRLSLRTTRTKGSGGFRGGISDFSPQSRKRMIETLVRLDWEKAGFVCFVTLGYPDRHGPPSLEQTERDRQVILKRIARMHPTASATWRREWEPRKSGNFVGEFFPHYHMLFFGLPFLHYDELNAMWREVIGYPYYVRTEIKQVHSWRQALYYCAKYMAKRKEGSPDPQARDARREARAPRGSGRSLVYVTYLTAREEAEKARDNKEIVGEKWQALKDKRRMARFRYRLQKLQRQSRRRRGKTEKEIGPQPGGSAEPNSIGRSWGTFNKRGLPWAERKVWNGRAGIWVGYAKHLAKQKWAGINESDNVGFTLFLDDAYQFFEKLLFLREPNL